MLRFVLILAVSTGISGCASLYDVNVGGASASYWAPTLSGEVSRDFAGLAGTNIDVEDELDLSDEQMLDFRAYVSAGPLTIEGTYFGVDYDGTNTISETISFRDQTFTLGTTLQSDASFDYAALKAKIGVIGVGPVAAGVIIGAAYVKLEGELNDSLTSISVGDKLESPFPVVGATVTVDQALGEDFSIFGELEAYGIAVEETYDLDGHFVDAQARAGVGLGPLKLGVGYRIIDFDLEETDDDDATYNLRLAGPYVFGEIAF